MASHYISQASHISVRISTSSSTLDLSDRTPFTITVKTILSPSNPITFKRPFTPVFSGLLYDNGLTFRNIHTDEYIPRSTIHSQYILSHNSSVPTKDNKKLWMTLYPDEPHILEATFKPTLAAPPITLTSDMTTTEMQQLQSQQIPVTTWNHVRDFEDGETYEIGITHTAAVKVWVLGSLDDILDATKVGTLPQVSTNKIHFTVIQSTRFTVARPDSDGSLNRAGA